eukprot:CAMPEP_0202896968 /NCGR_PEP_ID=MMETSP1392-20130828/5853_1 /ASSEMBLY_ACC=CAM_ASM_000868 /TAXON_ID=225041 /ORGANISM="Chlamydomonas chlamydogama, Strain SAG 11-48b" /LENGTH=41 /DNA_ID= /DNA_START= /DNA_END= /DNA_ORIENTATION=
MTRRSSAICFFSTGRSVPFNNSQTMPAIFAVEHDRETASLK